MKKTIIGIDPGASGGIAIYNEGKATAVAMPKGTDALNDYFAYIRESHDNAIVFLEKVNAFRGDKNDPGKSFGIDKMLENMQELKTLLKTNKLPYCLVPPVTWQSVLKLSFRGMEKPERKKKYKAHSQERYPEVKVTNATADALCLVSFGRIKLEEDPDWLTGKIIGDAPKNLFN